MGLERSMNVLYLIGYIKKILKINEGQSLFADVNGSVVSMTTSMSELCDTNLESDGFLYIQVKA
jgi:hypothetical protein